MDFILHAYCGLYCGACPILLQTKSGTSTEKCYGCKSEQTVDYCASCGIKKCAIQKGYAFCFECSDLNTCEQMLKFVADTHWLNQQGVLINMEMVQSGGLPNWLKSQDNRWRCKNCGISHSWWDETCPQCGSIVASCKEVGI